MGYHGYHFWCMRPYPKISENCTYALAATRKRQAALERLMQTRSTFNMSATVSMDVSKLWPMGWMDLTFIDARVKINGAYTTVRCFWLKSYCVSCVRSVASSLSSSKAMFLLTDRARQSIFWNEKPAFISPDLLPPNSTYLNPVHYRNMGISATAGIASSWCPWTEAALNRCLASLWAKRHRWWSQLISDANVVYCI